MLTVVSWNLNVFTSGRRAQKVALLDQHDWDVALLQEVDRRTHDLLAERYESRTALDLHDGGGSSKANGVVVGARPGIELGDAELIPVGEPQADQPSSPERAMVVPVGIGDQEVLAVSWHTPFAGDDAKREKKMRAYRAMHSWLAAENDTIVLGADVNSWTDPFELGSPDPDDPFYEEHRFLLADPDHGLVDAYREWLDEHPEELERIKRIRPDGPLAMTYDRGKKGYPTPCRMDRVFTTPDLHPFRIEHHYAEAISVGSDHALVRVELR